MSDNRKSEMRRTEQPPAHVQRYPCLEGIPVPADLPPRVATLRDGAFLTSIHALSPTESCMNSRPDPCFPSKGTDGILVWIFFRTDSHCKQHRNDCSFFQFLFESGREYVYPSSNCICKKKKKNLKRSFSSSLSQLNQRHHLILQCTREKLSFHTLSLVLIRKNFGC